MVKLKNNINEIIEQFDECAKNPISFLRAQPELEENVKSQLKSLYDLTKKLENYSTQNNFTLPKIIISHFDTEQIWQQVEIQNKFVCSELKRHLSVYTKEKNFKSTSDEEQFSDSTESDINDNDTDFGDDDVDDDDNIQEVATDEENNEDFNNDEDEEEEEEEENSTEKTKKDNNIKGKKTVRFDLGNTDVYSNETSKIDDENKSTFEKRQERLQVRVEKLEEEALAEKPWQLKGEVTAKTRPENSLLEEYLEFDVTTRPVPIITEEAALKLEDIILRRIKDKAWDDVERKIKPVDTPFEFKKKLVLDQEKSKSSLAKIYEQEYLKQKEAADPANKFEEKEEPREYKQIRNLLDSLFHKLDSLSNYHYTPLPAAPELQIVNNLPAVSLEEAIPAAISDATLLAPEEIKTKIRGDLKSKEERSNTDKKRSRRKKKLKQKLRRKAIESREKFLTNTKTTKSSKYGKEKVQLELEKLSQNSSVTHFQENTDNVRTSKSSKQFFEKLHDTVTAGKEMKRKKENVKFDAKKIKL